MKVFRSHLLICGGTGCQSSGSLAVKKALLQELDTRSLTGEIKVVETGCNGFCALGPIMVVYPEGVIYVEIKATDIPELVEEHLIKAEYSNVSCIANLLRTELFPLCRISPSLLCKNCVC
jgi:(2Fe-2S) ferredoxin